jgi:hypothetical protein
MGEKPDCIFNFSAGMILGHGGGVLPLPPVFLTSKIKFVLYIFILYTYFANYEA